jgi:hypothetical protein
MLVVRSISSQKGLRLESFCRGARVVLRFLHTMFLVYILKRYPPGGVFGRKDVLEITKSLPTLK